MFCSSSSSRVALVFVDFFLEENCRRRLISKKWKKERMKEREIAV